MFYGLDRIAGASSETTLGGRTLVFTPLTVAGWGVIQQAAISAAGDALVGLSKRWDGLPPAFRATAMETALAMSAREPNPDAEAMRFIRTPDGFLVLAQHILQPGQPDLDSPIKVFAVVHGLSEPERILFGNRVFAAAGLAALQKIAESPLANPPGPADVAGQNESSASPGLSSTANSPAPTDGLPSK
jgi:hypothetical protein